MLEFEHKPISEKQRLDALQAEEIIKEESERRRKERLTPQEKKILVQHHEAKDAARKLER